MRSAFIARKMNGAETPAYTRFAALAVAEVGTAHWTGQRIDTGWLAQALASGAVDQMQTNLLDEFGPDLRRAGTRVSNLLRRVFAGM